MSTRSSRIRTALLLLLLFLAACDNPAGPGTGLDLDALFQPATPAEMAAVEAEWAARAPAADEIIEETSSVVLFPGGYGTARVFSHVVDGHRHYGATLVPLDAAAGSLPVIVITHGGDTGVNVDDLLLVLHYLGEQVRDFAYVVPSFRSESVRMGGSAFTSQGTPSPWDRDVDDALAMLDVALARLPEADPGRIGVLGASRGGMVALLMAIRDPRIALVSELAGPTDFFGAWTRGLMEDALRGELPPLPGIHVLNERFIQPLAAGTITPAEFRLELVRRSPVLWADRLPSVQVHHGTADDVVPVGQAETLIAELERLGRAGLGDEFYVYPGGGHNVVVLQEVDARIIAFLRRLLQ